jgi:hypothetical protein
MRYWVSQSPGVRSDGATDAALAAGGDAAGHAEDTLRRWADRGLTYASSLPPK